MQLLPIHFGWLRFIGAIILLLMLLMKGIVPAALAAEAANILIPTKHSKEDALQPRYLANSIPILAPATDTQVLGYRMLLWPVQASFSELQENLAAIANCEPIAVMNQFACINEEALISFQYTEIGYLWSESPRYLPKEQQHDSEHYQHIFTSTEGSERSILWLAEGNLAAIYQYELNRVTAQNAKILMRDVYQGSFHIQADVGSFSLNISGWKKSATQTLVTYIHYPRGAYE